MERPGSNVGQRNFDRMSAVQGTSPGSSYTTTAPSMPGAAGMWNDGTIIQPPPAGYHAERVAWHGAHDSSGWQQAFSESAGVSWSSSHYLELELTSTGQTNHLTVRNLSTGASHTLVTVPQTCVPVIMMAARERSSSTVSLHFDTRE